MVYFSNMQPLHPRTDLALSEKNNNDVTVCVPPKTLSPDSPTVQLSVINSLGTDSFVSLITQLVEHVSHEWNNPAWKHWRDKNLLQVEARRKRMKILVYSVLFSYRKDYECETSPLRLTEVEEVMWHAFLLRQHRRYDDANALNHCIKCLENLGHLEVGSDVRNVLRFLVALKGCGGAMKSEPSLAKMTPRILQCNKNINHLLPREPLNYGDTFLHEAEHRPHYMHFPSTLFCLPSLRNCEAKDKLQGFVHNDIAPYDVADMIALSKATPGTGINPLLVGSEGNVHSGKVMGALVQETSEVTPDTILSIPELPSHAHGYVNFTLQPTPRPTPSPSTQSAVASDEGYASSRAGHPHTPGEEGEEEAIWEEVLKGPPLPARRTWETLGHIPTALEKPFISESGIEASHNIWIVYQDLWASLGGPRPPPLFVRSSLEICKDLLNLMIGVPSRSFLWNQDKEIFSVAKGLCHPGITPEQLHSSLLPYLECGQLVYRLDVFCSLPRYNAQELCTHGAVYRAFTVAVSNFLQVYRGWVFSLCGENVLAKLQLKAHPLIRKVKFVANLCKLTSFHTYEGTEKIENETQGGSLKQRQEIPHGISLLAELLNHMVVTKDRDCLLILISIFKNACVPFYTCLEDWVYRGVCQDPGREFMVEIDGEALLRRDREYWTRGYTLRTNYFPSKQNAMTTTKFITTAPLPPLLKEVLEEAFTCGKALNLLRLCSDKHYVVEGSQWEHPKLLLCTSRTEVEHMRTQCLAYAAHMDHLAAQYQITIKQKAERDKDKKHLLMMLSGKKHSDAIKAIERKMAVAKELVAEHKRTQLKELKAEMLKAEQRKIEEKEKEVEEDKIISRAMEEIEAKQVEKEQKLKNEMEKFYRQKLKIAERKEALAHWRVQRCLLGERRKNFITQTSWSPWQDEQRPQTLQEGKEERMIGECQKKHVISDNHLTEKHNEAKEDLIIDRELKIIKDSEDTKIGQDRISLLPVTNDGAFSPVSDIHLPQEDSSHLSFSICPQNVSSKSGLTKDYSPSDRQIMYPGHIDVKESPSQEMLSSVSDMTASLMSTSSDFVGTPFDENLPDFEVDPRRPGSSNSYIEDKVSPVYTRSTIESIIYDRSDNNYSLRNRQQPPKISYAPLKLEASVNKLKVLEEEYGIISELNEGDEEKEIKDSEGNIVEKKTSRSSSEDIRDKVLREEYNITSRGDVQTERDDNANFSIVSVPDRNNFSNSGKRDLSDSPSLLNNDINANISTEINLTVGNTTTEITLNNREETKEQDSTAKMSPAQTNNENNTDKNIGQSKSMNMNELVLEFRERRAQAAATREKIMNEEYHSTTTNKNSLNMLRSRTLSSSSAAKNKHRVFETEFELGEVEIGNRLSYNQQMSWSSISSYRSCSSSGRLSSVSTAFTTPDEEERPILIDQVGGEVLKERGRSVHGHASDAVIQKLLCHHVPKLSDASPSDTEESITPASTPAADIHSTNKTTSLKQALLYSTDHLKLMDGTQEIITMNSLPPQGKEPLLDITGSALHGRPSTREMLQDKSTDIPSTQELSCIPTYFIQSIRAHLATQSQLVNRQLLNEILVQRDLLGHFAILHSLLLLHDGHFASALTVNLFTKVEMCRRPHNVLVPLELNNVLNRALGESSWSTSPLADNFSFAVTTIPKTFTHPGSVLECLELRYHVKWPHTLILDNAALQAYSKVWCFLAKLHHTIWALDTLFLHMSTLGRGNQDGTLVRSPQFHQVCLFHHEIHDFLLVLKAYIVNQVHQKSWIQFKKKLEGQISSLDQLYRLHTSFITFVIARCFLTHKDTVIQKMIQDVFSLALRFHSQVLSQTWQRDCDTGSWQHPAFSAVKVTYQEFQKLAKFFHMLLVNVGQRVRMDPRHQELLYRLDFNGYYSR